MRRHLAGLALLLTCSLAGGCATTGGPNDPYREGSGGDLPWSTPASWEGGPLLPGLPRE